MYYQKYIALLVGAWLRSSLFSCLLADGASKLGASVSPQPCACITKAHNQTFLLPKLIPIHQLSQNLLILAVSFFLNSKICTSCKVQLIFMQHEVTGH